MNYRCVTNITELKEYIGNHKIIAFDFETAPTDNFRDCDKVALDPYKSVIAGISFSVAEGSAVYVPLRHRTGNNAGDIEEIMSYLKTEVFENKGIIKIAHNLSFEAMFLYHIGVVVLPPCYDTIAASQLTLKNSTDFRNLSDSGLKTLVPELYDVEMPKFEDVTKGRHFDELDPQEPETIRYACADSDYTLRLFYTINSWFDRFLPKHRILAEEIESPTAIYVGIMKHNGLLVDKELMLSKQKEAEERLTQLKDEIAFFIGDVEIGANASTAAFKNYLYKDLQLPVLKTTAKYQEAADDEAMILLSDWCRQHRPDLVKLFEFVQEYRKWGKIKSTYIDGYLEFINSETGRIHPDLFPLGTETGRFSSRRPNLQNMPRPDGDVIGVRSFIIAPDGKVLLSLDFSQIELRVGGFYCRDEKMLETYRTGGDIHAQTTSVIYRIPFEQAVDKNAEHYKERRTIAKNCNFGTFFGLFPKGLQKTLKFKAGLDTSLSECEQIISNLKAGYPRLSDWQEEVKKKAEVRKFTETFLGRRRYLPNISSSDWGKKSFAQRCALNTPIQGTAADILKLAIVRMLLGLSEREWLKPLLQIHDELVFEVPEDKVNEAVDFIKNCMEVVPFDEFDVPIVAEASVGVTFGKMKELEDK
ncbi:MAG TPA: bifunctional 3'-5' exonuclease/DNA polymerase [Clostridiales bacterium]|nr:bifunctional 3'-5' exonuclease/DNA polymerase [Clostridiales bacterium]